MSWILVPIIRAAARMGPADEEDPAADIIGRDAFGEMVNAVRADFATRGISRPRMYQSHQTDTFRPTSKFDWSIDPTGSHRITSRTGASRTFQ